MADTPTNLSDAVATAAQGPQEVAVAGMGMHRQHDLKSLIAAAKFVPTDALKKRVGAGIRFTKATAGGAV